MPKKRKYTLYICRDCEVEFLIGESSIVGKRYCGTCGEHIYLDKIKTIWVDKPINYKRPYTPEEDELIIVGKENGYTYKQISESIEGRTPQAIRRRYQTLKEKGMI